jgi:hypothetical protein
VNEARVRCPEGVDPADAAAWAVDGVPHPTLDLAEHVPTCQACQAAVNEAEQAASAASALRASRPTAPSAVTARAVGRVRLEATAWLLARTLGGSLARVTRALPSYIRPRR